MVFFPGTFPMCRPLESPPPNRYDHLPDQATIVSFETGFRKLKVLTTACVHAYNIYRVYGVAPVNLGVVLIAIFGFSLYFVVF